MDTFERIQAAIEHIEENLQEELPITEISAKACFSAFHFQRLFQAITGFSVQEYIRKRRLSEAAVLLKETQQSVLEIAVGYQYGSQEAFTRAFEACFGVTPAKYRRAATPLPLQKKMNFFAYQKKEKGTLSVNKPTIVELNAIDIIGYRYQTNLRHEQYLADIPQFYADFGSKQYFQHIPHKTAPDMAYGISCDFRDDGGFSFIVGEEVNAALLDAEPTRALPEGFVHFQLPPGKYAEFKVSGGFEQPQHVRSYIYGIWLPNSNYERREGPDFEITDVVNSSYPDLIKMKIYIPVD